MTRLSDVIHREMKTVNGQLMALPVLAPAELWQRSGRWSSGTELFKLRDKHGADMCLGATHEEVITDLVAQHLGSHRQLPLRAYQLDRKFRDEIRPRYGLMRAREFWMKDMYTFDIDEQQALVTYNAICQAYARLFTTLKLPFVRVAADSGDIGGELSHEFHVLSDVGEDTILSCTVCGTAANQEKAVARPAPAVEGKVFPLKTANYQLDRFAVKPIP